MSYIEIFEAVNKSVNEDTIELSREQISKLDEIITEFLPGSRIIDSYAFVNRDGHFYILEHNVTVKIKNELYEFDVVYRMSLGREKGREYKGLALYGGTVGYDSQSGEYDDDYPCRVLDPLKNGYDYEFAEKYTDVVRELISQSKKQ